AARAKQAASISQGDCIKFFSPPRAPSLRSTPRVHSIAMLKVAALCAIEALMDLRKTHSNTDSTLF
ncbi:MAG: hypothetical protein OXI62_10020, partial [Chloroflexota bacterium]|nr:hypothetical protein [Chloroflexota bacterium]